MKVLVVSHNVISKTGNMGKTISSYFYSFEDEEVAQYYIHSEVPTDPSVCANYYRFTDKNALMSLFSRKEFGEIYSINDIKKDSCSYKENTGALSAVYQHGRKRNASIFLARDMLWSLARWKTEQFKKWLYDFSPDIVLYMAGDYTFTYKIAMYAADLIGIPLVIACVDDFYLNNRNENSLLGKLVHRRFMKTVKKSMNRASCVFTISDTMRDAYADLFHIRCETLHTPSEWHSIEVRKNCTNISYIGNLSVKRNEQLVELGKAIKATEIGCIDVYSGEQNPAMIAMLTEENGIRFHGSISAEEVLKVMENSMAVIHTESFDPAMRNMTRFSVSTKIAESLMYGPCLIAYGPEGIASIDYLKENQAAYVITSPEDLQAGLEEIIGNAELRQEIVANARALAKKNHDASVNSANVRRWLEAAIEEYQSKKKTTV